MPESRFKQSSDLRLSTLLKKTLAQVFSCEFCDISKNTFFTEHLWWLLMNSIFETFLKFSPHIGISYKLVLKSAKNLKARFNNDVTIIRWVCTFFVILCNGKLAGWGYLIKLRDVTDKNKLVK